MISPEEDYDTWSLIVTTVEDDLPSFANLYPDIKRLFLSITQTGMLPDPISQRTDEFLSLQSNITSTFLNLYSIDESSFYIIIEYFQTVIEFSISQLKTRTQTALSMLDLCFADNYNLNSSNPDYKIRDTFIQFFLSINGYIQMIDCIKSETTSLDNIIRISELILKIKENIESFNDQEFSDTICDIFTRIANSDIRVFPVTTIESLLSKLPKSEKWLLLYGTFLKTDLFDKKLFALKKIDQMLNDPSYSEMIINFLKQNIETILSVPPHQEFYPLLGHICVVSLKHDIIPFDKIREFWNSQEFVHLSELNSFFSMFTAISNELPSIFANDFANLFLHPKKKSLEWVKALSVSCTNFMTLKYEAQFFELRDELFRIGFVDINEPISLEARRGIVNVSAAQINQLLPQVIDEKKVKATIEDIMYLISLTLNSTETIENTQEIIDFCFRHIDANLSSSIITKLCINHHAKISDIQLSQLMMIPSCISSLYSAHIINDEMMDNYFISLTQFDSGIASILLNYIYSHCKIPLTLLPIPKQELLWNLAIKFESYELCNGIGEIYSKNDGIMLTDSVMITAFLDIFEYYYKQSDNNQRQRSYLYKLLEEFIEKFEVNADFEEFHLHRHKTYQNDSIVYINVPQLNRQVTASYGNSISVAVNKILHLVGKNQYDTLVTFNGQYLVYSHPINLLGNTINAYYQNYNPSNDIPRVQLVRTDIPSIMICNCDLMNSLVNDLKDYGCWQLRVLINKLPTSTYLLNKIQNLQKMNSYNFESLIMTDYPYYSIYVLESLFGASISFDDLMRTGCISYIISIIPRFKIKAQLFLVMTFLSHLFDDQLAFYSDQIFDSFLRVILSQDYSISANCLPIIKKLKPKIPPYEDFKLIPSSNPNPNKLPEPQIAEYNNVNSKDELNEINTTDSTSQILSNVIIKYIFGSDGNMRISFSSNFNSLSIPLSYFTPHLDKINEINCNSLLTVMSSSLKEPNKEMADFALNNFNIESPIFQFVIKVFLEQLNNGQISSQTDPNKMNEIFEYIASNFLNANRPNCSPIVLNDAFEILSKAPSEILFNKLECISNVELNDYDINGDECSVQPTTTGLKNLGMSCFLNATLQQFFGIPCVRKAIISYKSEDLNQSDSLFLIEMKKLFGRMRDTVESFVSPANVVDKWITWEGTKLNPRIQQDASEFVQMLVDKLELGKVIPQSTFSGNLVQVIESIDDKNLFKTTRNESFSILSISISPTLDECFDKIHTPDFLNDYFAEPLGKKIDAKKTEFLGKNLPDHLIIQLKRFKFEYTTYEREKINDPVFFTEKIDINKHCFVSEEENNNNNNNNIYLLGGVIIHIGSAEGGHYISYVKQRDTGNWYEYNDNVVTPISLDYVMRNSNYNNQTAYILFYDKEGLNEIDDSELDPDLKKEVTERNELSKFYSVFCSTPFEFFINELGKRNEMKKEVILYAINVCPHLLFNQGSVREIIFQIKDILKDDENLCHFYFDNIKSFKPILFDNPSYVARNLICHNNLHPALKKVKIDENAFKKLMELFDQASIRINDSEHFFMILYWAIKSNPEIAEKFEVRKKVEDIVISIVQTNTKNKEKEEENEQQQSQQQIIQKQKNIYDQLNFNWISKIIVKLGPSKEFIEQIENNSEFFKLFILSNSDSRNYMKLYENNEKCEELIVNFLKKNSLYFSMPLVCGCLFAYLKEKAISFFPTLKFKMNNSFSNIADIAFCYVMLCYNMICDQLLLDHFNEWFIPISLSDNYDARLLINHSIFHLIRHKKIKDEIGYMNSRDKINYPESYFEITTVDNVNSIDMMNRIRTILNCLINNLDKVEVIINKAIPEPFSPSTPENVESSSWKIEQYQCYSYLQIMSILVEISQEEIVSEETTSNKLIQSIDFNRIIEFSHFLINHSHPYDVDIRFTIKALKDKIDDEFIDGIAVDLFDNSTIINDDETKPNTLIMISSRIRNVIEFLIPVIEKRNSLNESTIIKFAQTLCFSNMIQMFQYQEFIPRFITALTKLNKSAILNIIDTNFEQVCKNNIVSVLYALKTMNEKRNISNFMDACLSYKYFSYDDFIKLFVECNSGIYPNLKQLFWILNTSYYSLPTRKSIWKYLIDCNCDYLLFKNNFSNKDYGISNGDYIDIAKYLISRFDKENQQEKNEIIHHLIEMSISYMDVFSLAYNILKSNAIDEIKDKDFIKSLFSKKIGNNFEIFIDYCKNIAFPSLNSDEINDYFNSMFDFILRNLKSYNVILNDPAKGAFDDTEDDDNNTLTNVIISLSFMIKFKLCPLIEIKKIAKEIIEKMSNNDIWEKIKNEKIEKLKKVLIEIQTF